ncbi:MAG: PKD domain-containing protein [Planctomycetota bacterium]
MYRNRRFTGRGDLYKGVMRLRRLAALFFLAAGLLVCSNPSLHGSDTITAIAAGADFSAALESDGTVWTWGHNDCGQLGNGSYADACLPARISGLTGVTAIACGHGGKHCLALKSDGSVVAWGNNYNGQLGVGSTTNSAAPQQVLNLAGGVIAIAAGCAHSMALKSDGSLVTWGYNDYGQLGDGTTQQRTQPTAALIANVAAIYCGAYHSLVRRTDGAVWVWGNDNYGQLGDSLPHNQASQPEQIAGLMTMLAGGGAHSLSLTGTGKASAWGHNLCGQLGDATNVDRPSPVSVDNTNLAGSVMAIACGWDHSLALKTDGSVWCWGYNSSGELGDGTTGDKNVPVQAAPLAHVAAIAGGGLGTNGATSTGGHSLALRSDGTVWAWGANYYGQLGDGSWANRTTPVNVKILLNPPPVLDSLSPASATAGAGSVTVTLTGSGFVAGSVVTWTGHPDLTPAGLTPNQLTVAAPAGYLAAGGTANLAVFTPGPGGGVSLAKTLVIAPGTGNPAVISVKAGADFSVALMSDGTVWTWGHNDQGQLGNGSGTDASAPVQIQGLTRVTAVACGPGGQHCLALKSDGSVVTWGSNYSGQLGNDSAACSPVPIPVTNLGGGVLAIACGTGHSMVLRSDGSVLAWGDNSCGQLGDGTTQRRTQPAPAAIQGVMAIFCGTDQSFAIKSDRSVWAWGDNGCGELGYGTTDDSSLPLQISGLTTALAGGVDYSLGLQVGGTLNAWGSNIYGQLGEGTQNDRVLPVQVDNTDLAGRAVAIACGNYHSMALKVDGTVWCWGFNSVGQLGDGTNGNKNVPVETSWLMNVTAIAGGGVQGLWSNDPGQSLALESDGTVWAWGSNQYGQVGDGTIVDRNVPVKINFRNVPVITSPLTVTGTVGTAFSYQITATNSPTSFNAAGLPAGLTVNFGTGLISGLPAGAGVCTVTLSAANGDGNGTAKLALSLCVPPAITSGPSAVPGFPQVDGEAITFTVAAGDANGYALAYTWNFGDGSVGSGAQTTHTYSAAGTYQVAVTVDDGQGNQVLGYITVTVADNTPGGPLDLALLQQVLVIHEVRPSNFALGFDPVAYDEYNGLPWASETKHRGLPAIGIGYCLKDPNVTGALKKLKIGCKALLGDTPLTAVQNQQIFDAIIPYHIKRAKEFVGAGAYAKLKPLAKVVLVDLMYVGVLSRKWFPGNKQFPGKVRDFQKALTAQDYQGAANAIAASKWAADLNYKSRAAGDETMLVE